MKTIYLDGWRMGEREKAHAYLKRRLGFPAYYGNNLDALYDLLTEGGEETRLILRGAGKLAAPGSYGEKLIQVLRDASEENPLLTVEIRKGLF